MFIETSALAAENVSLAFEELLNSISDIKQQKMNERFADNYQLNESRACLKLNDPELE